MSEVEPFSNMATRIANNAAEPFGGACVIVPPGEVEPIELLILDVTADPDPAQFLALVKSRIDFAIIAMERNLATAGRR
jgi:hypothetical protein